MALTCVNSIVSFVVLLSALDHSLSTNLPEYTVQSECVNFAWTMLYSYASVCHVMHDKRGTEEIIITATVEIRCQSVGTYQNEPVTEYSLKVRDVSGKMLEAKTDGEKIVDSMTNSDAGLQQDFRFLRNDKGKVTRVEYPPDESEELVNFKKTIASAFQANFAHTEEEKETDSQSTHIAHYKFKKEGNRVKQHRKVTKEDVIEYSGRAPKGSLNLNIEDDIETDDEHIIHKSSGFSKVSVAGNDLKEDNVEGEEGIVDQDIPPMESSCKYSMTLKNRKHRAAANEFTQATRFRMKRAVQDTLIAKIDPAARAYRVMRDLHNQISDDIEDTVRRYRRDTNTKQAAKEIMKLRMLLQLEAEHGPIPGKKDKVIELVEKLKKIEMKTDDHNKNVRELIYSLLSTEGSLLSQKALLRSLGNKNMNRLEYASLMLALALLTSSHPSTEEAIREHMERNDDDFGQLLLTYGSLGRHGNIENRVVMTLVDKLQNVLSSDVELNTTVGRIMHIIHALGNSGSKQIVPYLTPFLYGSDLHLKLVSIDALRAVSREENVQQIFTSIVNSALNEDPVIKVVESLKFPFEQSLYFTERPDKAGETKTEQTLMKAIVAAALQFNDIELMKITQSYLKYVGTELAVDLQNRISYGNVTAMRLKRASTTNWDDSSYSDYNFIASQSNRARDELDYPYHKAFLWATRLGPSKLHIKIAAGGFAGVGSTGGKVFARGVVGLHAFGKTVTAVELEFSLQIHSFLPYLKEYARICGITYYNKEIGVEEIPYTIGDSKTLKSVHLFGFTYSIWIYVGTLDFYLSAELTGDVNFELTLGNLEVNGVVDFGPTLTVTGGASATILIIWRIGLEATASIGYYISPTATTTFCDTSPPGDATQCFGLYHGSKGIEVSIYGYYQLRKCKFSWKKGFKCSWSNRNEIDLFSSDYQLGATAQRLAWGKCGVCRCGAFGKYCKTIAKSGTVHTSPGVSSCSCDVVNYA